MPNATVVDYNGYKIVPRFHGGRMKFCFYRPSNKKAMGWGKDMDWAKFYVDLDRHKADNPKRVVASSKRALIKRKEAFLDGLDDQIMGLPAGSPKFDTLAIKREDMETEIRKLREGIEVLNAWDVLKGGDWSDEMRQALNAIDPQVVDLATSGAKQMDEKMMGGGMDMGMGGGLGMPPTPAIDPLAAAPPPPPPAPVPDDGMPDLDGAGAPPPEEEMAPLAEEPPIEEPPAEEPEAAPEEEPMPMAASKKKSSKSKKAMPYSTPYNCIGDNESVGPDGNEYNDGCGWGDDHMPEDGQCPNCGGNVAADDDVPENDYEEEDPDTIIQGIKDVLEAAGFTGDFEMPSRSRFYEFDKEGFGHVRVGTGERGIQFPAEEVGSWSLSDYTKKDPQTGRYQETYGQGAAELEDRLNAMQGGIPPATASVKKTAKCSCGRLMPCSACSKKSNFKTPDMSGKSESNTSSQKKGTSTMATTTTPVKPSLKERIAAIKQKRAEAINKEAQTRVASAWTVAKTLLPTAPVTVQQKLAQSLLANSTKALKVICQQTARNAAYHKALVAIAEVQKKTLNDLMAPPSELTTERNAVAAEMRKEPKDASVKKADDRKDAGPQPATYPEPKRNEPAEIDAGKAGNRDKATVDKTMNDQKVSPKEAAKSKKAECECKGEGCEKCGEKKASSECECKGKGCDKCASAKSKTAGPPVVDEAPEGNMPPPPPMDDVPPPPGAEGDEPPMDEEGDAATDEVVADEEKLEVVEQIDEVIQDIEQIKDEIEDQSQELNLDTIFDTEEMEAKEASLANNGNVTAGEDEMIPSSSSEMEGGLEQTASSDIADMFMTANSDADPMSRLFASSTKYAEFEDLVGPLPESEAIKPGDAAKEFKTKAVGAETRDNESDHDDSLLTDILNSLKDDEYDSKRDTGPKLETPPATKESSAKKPIAKLKTVAAPTASSTQTNLAALLFGDEDE